MWGCRGTAKYGGGAARRWRGRGSVGPGTVPGTVAGRQTRQDSPGTAPPPLNPRQNSPSNLKNVKFGVFRARRANFFAHNPTTADAWSAGESKRPGRGARGRRQGTAIARQPARGLRQSTTLFAQQQPRQATSGTKLSPHTHPRRMCGTKLSQHEPHGPTSGTKLSSLARNGLIWRFFYMQGEFYTVVTTKKPSRENFVPNARQRSSKPTQHTRHHRRVGHRRNRRGQRDRGDRGAGRPGRGAGGRLAGPTRVRRASARKISHIISHGHFSRPPENVAIPTMQIQCLNKLLGNYVRNCSDGSKTPAKQISHAIRLDQNSTNPENVAIPTMQIQCLNKLLGNCMRNCCADGPGRGAARRRQGRGSVGPGTVPGTVAGRGSVGPGTVPGTVAGRQTRQNSPGTAPPPLNPRQNSPSNLKNVKFGVFRARRANFFAHRPTIRPCRVNFFAHRTRRRGDIETNNTTATTDAGQRETTVTTARP